MIIEDFLKELEIAFTVLKGRQDIMLDIFWNTLWEVESIVKPNEILVSVDYTAIDEGSHYAVHDTDTFYDIKQVIANGKELVRVSKIYNLPSFIPSFSFYQKTKTDLLINKGTTPPPSLDVKIVGWTKTFRVDLLTFSADHMTILNAQIKAGMLMRASQILGDINRAQLFKQDYYQSLGIGG